MQTNLTDVKEKRDTARDTARDEDKENFTNI